VLNSCSREAETLLKVVELFSNCGAMAPAYWSNYPGTAKA